MKPDIRSYIQHDIKIDKPLIMGILNVTPDSFSDGGLFNNVDNALKQALKMHESGAEIIDVGGESTRPGSKYISESVEIERVIPVIEKIRSSCDAIISIDTSKPLVAEAAIDAGAQIINDVSNLRDINLAKVAASKGAVLMIMHSRGEPSIMHEMVDYGGDVVGGVKRELLDSADRAIGAGVERDKIWIDPGIGFAKTVKQNLELLAFLKEFVDTGFPVFTGPSRKSFIGSLTGAGVDNRLGGTSAAVVQSILEGAKGVRIHDVEFMKQVVLIAEAIYQAKVEYSV
ncbi:MAG: dihydropteroate synthase [Deltaproteobacteria bacterium]|nr:dihydropteroate synthase [Deltaproteobacteria bacterium]